MKIRKTAEQQNFRVDTDWYTESDLNRMVEMGKIWKDDCIAEEDGQYRVFVPYFKDEYGVDSVNVELTKFGWYGNVATMTDGTKIHIIL